MRERLASKRVHAAEPTPGSFRAVTGDGDEADLFNLNHYPVHAVCRVCNKPIRAEAFMLAFRHEKLQLSSGGTTPDVRAAVGWQLQLGLAGHEGQAVTGQGGGQ
jgi:hypothetical protein